MNNVIDCICRNLPHSEVRVTSPALMKDQEFIVVGFDCLDSDIPIIVGRKPDSKTWFNICYNLIEKIIIIP